VAPVDVQFTDTSMADPPVTEWFWEFGDGAMSTETNPLHTYAETGDYVVTLWVTSTEGSDWVTDTVTVNPLPEASFDYAPDTGLMPLTVYFSNTSMYATNPTWDLGDGNMGAGDYVSHTYAMTGTYYVTLTVDSAYGCGTAEAYGMVVVFFETAPIASFDADPMMGCGAPLEVQFTDTSIAEPDVDAWFWDLGDGATSTETNPLHTYAATGDYVVTLLVTNTLGSDEVTGTISVYDLPMAMFDYDPAVGYAPLTVTFTNTSMYGENAVWDFGDGNMGAGDNVTHTYAMTGTFTVALTVTSPYGCGDATANADITVYEPGTCIPVTIVAVNQTPTGCVVDLDADLTGEAPFTYTWNFGAFGTFDTAAVQVDFGASGTYTGTLDVWNCGGEGHDMAAFDVVVTCEPPPVYAIYLPVVYK
jgi:PKD repeat protein